MAGETLLSWLAGVEIKKEQKIGSGHLLPPSRGLSGGEESGFYVNLRTRNALCVFGGSRNAHASGGSANLNPRMRRAAIALHTRPNWLCLLAFAMHPVSMSPLALVSVLYPCS
jgi:hypothetical protein